MNICIDDKGIRDLKRTIEDALPKEAQLSELFSSEFLRKYTKFTSYDNMFSSFDVPIETTEDYNKYVSTPEWESFIRKNTEFPSYQDMLEQAAVEYVDSVLSRMLS